MRSSETNSPTSGRLRISSTTLPTYMLATKPQNSSGCWAISIGPGDTPCTITAAIITAVNRPGRYAERQHRHERAGRSRVVGRLGTRDALRSRPGRSARGACDSRRSIAVGDERRDDMRRAGDDADQEAEHAAARDRPDRLRAAPGATASARAGAALLTPAHRPAAGGQQDLGHPEQSDRDRNDADAVAELDDAERRSACSRSSRRCRSCRASGRAPPSRASSGIEPLLM